MLLVGEVMTTRLITLSPSDTLKTAREIMKKARIRHLPVLSAQGGFIGLLTQRDLLKASVSQFADVNSDVRDEIEGSIPVSEVMSADVLTIPSDMPLSQAAELLLAHKYGCLPVLDNGHLAGILTEADFVKLCLVFLEQSASSEDGGG